MLSQDSNFLVLYFHSNRGHGIWFCRDKHEETPQFSEKTQQMLFVPLLTIIWASSVKGFKRQDDVQQTGIH